MADKTNTGLTMDSDVLRELDNEILMLKAEDKAPDRRIRSEVITEIVRDWLATEDKIEWAEEHGFPPEDEGGVTGNQITTTAD